MTRGEMSAETRVAILAPFRGGLVARGAGPDGPFSLPSALQVQGMSWQQAAQAALEPHLEFEPENLRIIDVLAQEEGNLMLVGLNLPPDANPSYSSSDLYAIETRDLAAEWVCEAHRAAAAGWFSERDEMEALCPGTEPHDTLIIGYNPGDAGLTGRAWVEDAEGDLIRFEFDLDDTVNVDTEAVNWMSVDAHWIEQLDQLHRQFSRVSEIMLTRLVSVSSEMPLMFREEIERNIPIDLIEDILTPVGVDAARPDAFLFVPRSSPEAPDAYVLISDPRIHIETDAAAMGANCWVRQHAKDGAEARCYRTINLENAKSLALTCASRLNREESARGL